MKIGKNNQKLYFNVGTNLFALKKSLSIIHKYNLNSKRILFIGNFNKNLETALINTKHLFVPESIWVNGILTNPSACFKYLIKHQHNIDKKKMQNIVQLKKRIDLIVVIGVTSISNIFTESYKTQTPTISFDSLAVKEKATYQVSNSLKFKDKKKNIDFISALILATIIKSKISLNKKKPKFYKIKKLFG